MTTYDDLEIKCLVGAIDDYANRTLNDVEARGLDLQNILREMSHVLDLLGERHAASKLRDLVLNVGTDFFTVRRELGKLEKELEEFLEDEFDCSSMDEVRASAWLRVPEELSASDTKDILRALAGMPNLYASDAIAALQAAADKNG